MAPGQASCAVLTWLRKADLDYEKTFATLTFTKISICLFLLRITITKNFIRPLQAAVIILVLSNVILSLVWIFQCSPHLDKAWNDDLPGKCFSKGQLERIIISQAREYPYHLRSHPMLTLHSGVYNLRLLPLRLSYPYPPQSSNQPEEQDRTLPPDGPRGSHWLTLDSPHSPKLAERNRRSNLAEYPQLVLAHMGSLLRHHRGLHTDHTTRLQVVHGRTTHHVHQAKQ